jgi:hypothetical protein
MAARAWEEFTAAPYGPDSAPSREWRYEHQSLAWTCNGLLVGECSRASCEVDMPVKQTYAWESSSDAWMPEHPRTPPIRIEKRAFLLNDAWKHGIPKETES